MGCEHVLKEDMAERALPRRRFRCIRDGCDYWTDSLQPVEPGDASPDCETLKAELKEAKAQRDTLDYQLSEAMNKAIPELKAERDQIERARVETIRAYEAEVTRLREALDSVKKMAEEAPKNYRKYIRAGFEQTDFNGFCAGVIHRLLKG